MSRSTPEDTDGELPSDLEATSDNPDEWRDACDDPPGWGDDDD